MIGLIHVVGRSGAGSAHSATMSEKTVSVVTRKRSDTSSFFRLRDRRNPSSGRIARWRGSTQWTDGRSEEHTSELQSLMRISYAVFCLKKKKNKKLTSTQQQ